MSIDPETLMAYADGELDLLGAKRVERAIAADPALADEVERHRALRGLLANRFAPVVEEPVPDRLTALLESNLVALPEPKTTPLLSRWREMAALAACLVLGLSIGLGVRTGLVTTRGDRLYASGVLAHALDTQLASSDGSIRVPVSFRNRSGQYCRLFASAATDGIACRDSAGWALRQTREGSNESESQYRQAGSGDPALMAAAQDMMSGEPLDASAETKARGEGWR